MPTVSPPSIRKSLRTPKAPTRLGDDESLPPPTRLEPVPVTAPVLPTPTRLEPASTPLQYFRLRNGSHYFFRSRHLASHNELIEHSSTI